MGGFWWTHLKPKTQIWPKILNTLSSSCFHPSIWYIWKASSLSPCFQLQFCRHLRAPVTREVIVLALLFLLFWCYQFGFWICLNQTWRCIDSHFSSFWLSVRFSMCLNQFGFSEFVWIRLMMQFVYMHVHHLWWWGRFGGTIA